MVKFSDNCDHGLSCIHWFFHTQHHVDIKIGKWRIHVKTVENSTSQISVYMVPSMKKEWIQQECDYDCHWTLLWMLHLDLKLNIFHLVADTDLLHTQLWSHTGLHSQIWKQQHEYNRLWKLTNIHINISVLTTYYVLQ